MNNQEIIKQLKAQIDTATSEGDDLDSVSRGEQIGVLISVDFANQIVNALQNQIEVFGSVGLNGTKGIEHLRAILASKLHNQLVIVDVDDILSKGIAPDIKPSGYPAFLDQVKGIDQNGSPVFQETMIISKNPDLPECYVDFPKQSHRLDSSSFITGKKLPRKRK